MLRWTPGAIEAYRAIRERARNFQDGFLPWREVFSALVIDTDPGKSLLGSVLRDPNVWPAASTKINPKVRVDRDNFDRLTNFASMSFQAETYAKKERAHLVGERHLAQLIVDAENDVAILQIDPKTVYKQVRELELGPEVFRQPFGWDGLIDTNIILQYKDIWTIDWRGIIARPDPPGLPVTLWISSALLSEIDDQVYYSRNQRVARKARAFSRWLKGQVNSGRDIENGIYFNKVGLQLLTTPMEDIPPDTRHLEAALRLRDRQVPVTVITHDTLFRLRAIQAGFQVLDLPDDLLEEREPAVPTDAHQNVAVSSKQP